MLSRLRFNIDASGATPEISIFPVIAGAHAGEARFAINETNRGASRVAEEGPLAVAVRPLTQMIDDAGLSRIDVLKIDIEGGEYEALYPFFASTGAHFWPTMIIAETSHERDGASLRQLLEDKGYKAQVKTARNVVVTRRSGL
jgi:FkbM family methyltransferase